MINKTPDTLGRLKQFVEEHHSRLLNYKHVWAVGLGYDEAGDTLVIRVYIEPGHKAGVRLKAWRAIAPGQIMTIEAKAPVIDRDPSPNDLMAPEPEGLTNGVVVAGRSIAKQNSTSWGTLGAVVLITGDKTLYGLTCYHVISDSQPPPVLQNIIVQPGGSTETRDTIGWVMKGSLASGQAVGIDAALIGLNRFSTPYVKYLGRPAGTSAPTLDGSLRKYGASTGFSRGSAVTFEAFVKVKAGKITRKIGPAALVVTPNGHFAKEGDSGALVMDDQNNAIGMVVAGNTEAQSAVVLYFSAIAAVFTGLGVQAGPLSPSGAPTVFLTPGIGTNGVNQTVIATRDSSNLIEIVVRENDMYFGNAWTSAANPKAQSNPKGGPFLKETHIAYIDTANNLIDVWYDAATRTIASAVVAANVMDFAPPTYFWSGASASAQVLCLVYADTSGWLWCSTRDEKGNWTSQQLTSSTVGEPARGNVQAGLFTDFGGFFMAFFLDTHTASAGRLCMAGFNTVEKKWGFDVLFQNTFVSISNPMNFLAPSGAYLSVCCADSSGVLWMAQYFAVKGEGWVMNQFSGDQGVLPNAPVAWEAPSMAGTVYLTTPQWHVVYREKSTGNLYLIFWDPGDAMWNTFQLTGSGSIYFPDLPAAATAPTISSDGQRAYCVYRDASNKLWHLWWTASGATLIEYCHALL